MRATYWLAVLGIVVASPLAAKGTMPSFTSEVYQTSGDHVAITRRANTCAAQLLHSGLQTIPVIISSDPEAGTVVAHNTFRIPIGKLAGFDARSNVTIEAKDGRFRIVYTDIETLIVNNWETLSGTDRLIADATRTLNEISGSVAGCINKSSDDSW